MFLGAGHKYSYLLTYLLTYLIHRLRDTCLAAKLKREREGPDVPFDIVQTILQGVLGLLLLQAKDLDPRVRNIDTVQRMKGDLFEMGPVGQSLLLPLHDPDGDCNCC